MSNVGETEFGGVDGLLMQGKRDLSLFAPHEQAMVIYATNPGNAEATANKDSWQEDPNRVGDPEAYQQSSLGWDEPA